MNKETLEYLERERPWVTTDIETGGILIRGDFLCWAVGIALLAPFVLVAVLYPLTQ